MAKKMRGCPYWNTSSTADIDTAAPSATITPVLGGLAAPRGIAFDGKGSMYVAESGVAGPGDAGMTDTGKVDKFAWGQTTPACGATARSRSAIAG